MSRELFEQEILKKVDPKYETKEYAIKKYSKGNKRGQYVKYETNIAWQWWNKALEMNK